MVNTVIKHRIAKSGEISCLAEKALISHEELSPGKLSRSRN
jgi:hypothetical protein